MFHYDPVVFNYVLMVLYVLNTLNWLSFHNYPQALYWFAAFQITLAVTLNIRALT